MFARKLFPETQIQPANLYYPNRLVRTFFIAMDDVLGQHGLHTLLELSELSHLIDQTPDTSMDRTFDYACIASMNQALEDLYGIRGGRGMALRIGRVAFAKGWRNFGVMNAMKDPAFRVLPLAHRVELSIRALVGIFTHFCDQYSWVEVTDKNYLLKTRCSSMAWGRESDRPACHIIVGMIQECLSWATNGYEFNTREVECCAKGDEHCSFRVERMPLNRVH